MNLRVEAASPVPPYEQIRLQVTSMVRLGVLGEGARLPSIRQLANDLGLAGGTVARAYRELEQDGVVVTRGRHGTIVRRATLAGTAPELEQAAAVYAATASRLGANEHDAVTALREALIDLTTSRRTA